MNLPLLDIVILLGYFAAVAAIGAVFSRGRQSTDEFFLGGRRIPWPVVAASLFATEISALTVISVPAKSFTDDFWYLQYFFGSALARVAIAFVLLPAFYGNPITTVYEYLGRRFGRLTRGAGTAVFFLSRTLGSGVRLLAASIALSEITGWSLLAVILIQSVIAVGYVFFGGIKAIVWTEAFQAGVFLSAAIGAALYLALAEPYGLSGFLESSAAAGKWRVFHLDWHLNTDTNFGLGLLNGFFMTFASLGTDQDFTQRMLTCRTLRESQRSILVTAVIGFPIVALFLSIGTGMFVYAQHHGLDLSGSGDRAFPFFIVNIIPPGLRGLLVAGIFAAAMSSLASALGALATSAVVDVYRPLLRRDAADPRGLAASRVFVVLFAAIKIALALMLAGETDMLRLAFQLGSLVFGPLLGIFLAGTLTQRGRDGPNLAAITTSLAALTALHVAQKYILDHVYVAWPWYIVIGTVWTFAWAVSARGRLSAPRD